MAWASPGVAAPPTPLPAAWYSLLAASLAAPGGPLLAVDPFRLSDLHPRGPLGLNNTGQPLPDGSLQGLPTFDLSLVGEDSRNVTVGRSGEIYCVILLPDVGRALHCLLPHLDHLPGHRLKVATVSPYFSPSVLSTLVQAALPLRRMS